MSSCLGVKINDCIHKVYSYIILIDAQAVFNLYSHTQASVIPDTNHANRLGIGHVLASLMPNDLHVYVGSPAIPAIQGLQWDK